MKKLIAICACAASVLAFGAANDVVLTFSSTGTDIYADGTTVLDGECYALVWIPKGSTGFAIAADGTEVDPAQGKIILTAPVAKGGRCPTIAFQLSAAIADKYTDGEWALYLLDTRKIAANGAVTLAGVANGRAKAVNAAGLVTSGTVKAKSTAKDSDTAPASLEAGASVSATMASAVPANAPKPQIKDIKVADGLVYVTVANTAPYLQYNLTAGDTPSTINEEKAAETPVNGSVDEDIILIAPAKENGGFFRVNRN